MPLITLDAAGPTIATIDLGEANRDGVISTDHGSYFESGDLGFTSGNLYINIDGQEYGSLFFFQKPDGTITITLGHIDVEHGDWIDTSVLNGPIEGL